MQIEQFQQIITLIQSLGGEAKNAFILWLIFTNGLSFVLSCGMVVTLLYIVKYIVGAICINLGNEALLCEVRDILRIGCSGALTASERNQVANALRKLLAKERSE